MSAVQSGASSLTPLSRRNNGGGELEGMSGVSRSSLCLPRGLVGAVG